MVRTVFDQPAAASVQAQFAWVVEAIEARFPDAATHLDDAREDLLAFTMFPHEIWRQICSNNPNRAAIIRLVGAVLAEQTRRMG